METQFEVAYNSDLIIRDDSEAATLCVFYDRVYLPFTDRDSSRELIGSFVTREDFTNEIANWDIRYGTLFDEGVLRRLPAAVGPKKIVNHERIRRFIEFPRDTSWARVLVHDGAALGMPDTDRWRDKEGYYYEFESLSGSQEIIDSKETFVTAWYRGDRSRARRKYKCRLLTVREWEPVELKHEIDVEVDSRISNLLSLHVDRFDSGNSRLIRLDLARHFIREDISIPQIFSLAKGCSSKEVFVALEATSTFRYLLPKVVTFHPTQILDLREKVKDTREGFTMHLWKLSRGLEERAVQGASLTETAQFANDLIKTDLIPDYREFQRQIESLRAERLGKYLDAAGRIAEIDAAPWTPKFWALVLKAIGLSAVKSQTERKSELSNRFQAFKFMSYIERSELGF